MMPSGHDARGALLLGLVLLALLAIASLRAAVGFRHLSSRRLELCLELGLLRLELCSLALRLLLRLLGFVHSALGGGVLLVLELGVLEHGLCRLLLLLLSAVLLRDGLGRLLVALAQDLLEELELAALLVEHLGGEHAQTLIHLVELLLDLLARVGDRGALERGHGDVHRLARDVPGAHVVLLVLLKALEAVGVGDDAPAVAIVEDAARGRCVALALEQAAHAEHARSGLLHGLLHAHVEPASENDGFFEHKALELGALELHVHVEDLGGGGRLVEHVELRVPVADELEAVAHAALGGDGKGDEGGVPDLVEFVAEVAEPHVRKARHHEDALLLRHGDDEAPRAVLGDVERRLAVASHALLPGRLDPGVVAHLRLRLVHVERDEKVEDLGRLLHLCSLRLALRHLLRLAPDLEADGVAHEIVNHLLRAVFDVKVLLEGVLGRGRAPLAHVCRARLILVAEVEAHERVLGDVADEATRAVDAQREVEGLVQELVGVGNDGGHVHVVLLSAAQAHLELALGLARDVHNRQPVADGGPVGDGRQVEEGLADHLGLGRHVEGVARGAPRGDLVELAAEVEGELVAHEEDAVVELVHGPEPGAFDLVRVAKERGTHHALRGLLGPELFERGG
mmetsp:Transcript_18593/g.58832  ORF Transcript_18593/g.58832 Transcript_18593/m.58832 type:complete len:627 (-) Transcript_18593:1284-3164(-)